MATTTETTRPQNEPRSGDSRQGDARRRGPHRGGGGGGGGSHGGGARHGGGHNPRPADTQLELMKLAYETSRHYGNMRFTMFTVFTAVVGALMAVPFTTGGSQFIHAELLHKQLLCAAGLVAGLFFGLSEFRISRLVIFYQEAAFGLGALAQPPGHKVWRRVVGFTMLIPSAVTVAFWLLLAYDVVSTPLLTGS